MNSDPQNNMSKKSTSVAASPFNGLKLDAILWFCSAIILLLLLENLNISDLIEYVVLFFFGLVAVISTVVRANHLVKSQNSEKPE